MVGADDVFRLEVERQAEPGTVGGYISPLDQHNGGLVLFFDGACAVEENGEEGVAFEFYCGYATAYRAAGFMTWCATLRECGTSYGDGDLRDAIELVDWLDREGREYLGIDRVYIVGYSTGAIVANLLNAQRQVTAIVSLSTLADPNQFDEYRPLYDTLIDLFPLNSGFCQLRSTLEGRGTSTWDALNVVDQVERFHSPTLFMHGLRDFVFLVDNTQKIEARYRALLEAGRTDLPELEFVYVPNAGHFATTTAPNLRDVAIEYLLRFEPAAE